METDGLIDRLRAFGIPERGWELSAGDVVDAAEHLAMWRDIALVLYENAHRTDALYFLTGGQLAFIEAETR